MICPQCSNLMVRTKATNFGEEYDYCRTCKQELSEMPKRGSGQVEMPDDDNDEGYGLYGPGIVHYMSPIVYLPPVVAPINLGGLTFCSTPNNETHCVNCGGLAGQPVPPNWTGCPGSPPPTSTKKPLHSFKAGDLVFWSGDGATYRVKSARPDCEDLLVHDPAGGPDFIIHIDNASIFGRKLRSPDGTHHFLYSTGCCSWCNLSYADYYNKPSTCP